MRSQEGRFLIGKRVSRWHSFSGKAIWNSAVLLQAAPPAKQKLIELKNRYDTPENRVLVLVQSDGDTRVVWGGISDKEIGGYDRAEAYYPTQVNVGTPHSPYLLSLADSGVRIVRIRSNQEVPDYFTELSAKASDENLQRSSASGIFKYEDVYWGIHTKPNDMRYTHSLKESKIDYPKHFFLPKRT